MSEVVSRAIKAIVRVRPFTPKEAASQPLPMLRVTGGEISIDKSSIQQAEQGMDLAGTTSERRTDHDSTFSFDSVLWSVEPPAELPDGIWPPVTGQEEVFQQAGVPAVDAMLSGYNVSIFAYGQTGSGKSHTVFGPRADPGLAPRISDLLFERVSAISEKGTGRTEVEVSCFEIYNEKITDLLAARSSRSKQPQQNKGRRGAPVASASSGSVQRRPSTITGLRGDGDSADLSPRSGGVQRRPSGTINGVRSPSDMEPVDLSPKAGAAQRRPSTIPGLRIPPSAFGGGGGDGGDSRGDSPRNQLCDTLTNTYTKDPWGDTATTFCADTFTGTTRDLCVDANGEDGGDDYSFADEEDTGAALSPPPETIPLDFLNLTSSSSPTAAARKELKVRFSPQLGVYVEGLRKEQVTDAVSLNVAIHQALDHRIVASTNMNSGSSRSHAVIQISVEHLDEVHGKKISATLSLVDLAGSERVERSGAQGQQFVEAKNINQSLSVLRRVIDTITDNQGKKSSAKHIVPFRESTLTWILMDCFGGTSFTMMIAAISPHLSNLTDTLGTLRYASKCKKIVNTVKSNEVRVAVTMHAVQKEMERVKKEMQDQQNRLNQNLSEMDSIKNQIQKKGNAAQLFKKRADAKRDIVKQLGLQLDQATLDAAPTLARYEDLLSLKKAAEEASLEIINHREQTENAVAKLDQGKPALNALQYQVAKIQNDVKWLEGALEETEEISNALRASWKRRLRRQLLVATHEYQGNNDISALAAEVAALKEASSKLSRELEDMTTDIEVQQSEVDEVSQFERAANRAASDLCTVHKETTVAAAAYRTRTGDVTRQIDAALSRMCEIDEQKDKVREDHAERMFFAASVVEELREEVEEAVAMKDAITTEVYELTDSHATFTSRVDFLVAELASYDTQLETEFHHSVRLQSLIKKETEATNAEEEALNEELKELGRIEAAKADANRALISTNVALREQSHSLKTAQHTTRLKIFPDAPKRYVDPVVSRMALDLEKASSPKVTRHLRRSPNGSPSGSHFGSPAGSQYGSPYGSPTKQSISKSSVSPAKLRENPSHLGK